MSGHNWPWPYSIPCTESMRCCSSCRGEVGHVCADAVVECRHNGGTEDCPPTCLIVHGGTFATPSEVES